MSKKMKFLTLDVRRDIGLPDYYTVMHDGVILISYSDKRTVNLAINAMEAALGRAGFFLCVNWL